jgi:hypothetical protein
MTTPTDELRPVEVEPPAHSPLMTPRLARLLLEILQDEASRSDSPDERVR